jgi:HAD superfamily hydrolase (TIGR01490 family)
VKLVPRGLDRVEVSNAARIAAFDFDGTLTRRDSLLPFLRMVAGARLLPASLRALPQMAGYAIGVVPNWKAKEALLRGALEGLPAADLEAYGVAFARDVIPGLLRPGALDQIRKHRAQGDVLALVSASLEVYLVPWARAHGFDVVAGTRLETRDGILTGRLHGSNCWGPEKVARLRLAVGGLDGRSVVAYGDGRGDRELLDLAKTSGRTLSRTA